MVYINGFFHADPHHVSHYRIMFARIPASLLMPTTISQGNLLIRPKAPKSKSPFNFDIVLLDHGQYFDLDDDLRVNYARFWLSLISPETPKNLKKRKHYAKLVANVGDDLVYLCHWLSCRWRTRS